MNLLFPKVPSGITGLDRMIGGGFTKNSVITLSGSTGSGRTTFATQFLVNGWRQNQEPGIFLSFNEPKYSIFANMSSFDWNLPELERNKQVVFIEYPQSELPSFMEQEGSILELIDTLGVERVVFDSITPLAMLSDGDERVRSLQKLINVIRKWGVTTMITAEDLTPPDPDLPRTNVGIEAMTDGFVHLGWMREGNRRLRTLEVVKMRGSAHAHLIHLTTIDSNGYRLVESEAPEAVAPAPNPVSKSAGARSGAARMGGAPKTRGDAPDPDGAGSPLVRPLAPQAHDQPVRAVRAVSLGAGVPIPGAAARTARATPVRPGREEGETTAPRAPSPPTIRPAGLAGLMDPRSTTPVPKPPARKPPAQ